MRILTAAVFDSAHECCLYHLQGAQEIFQELPHEFVEPEHLHKVAKHGGNKPFAGHLIRATWKAFSF